MHIGDIMSTVGDIIFCNLSAMGDIMIHVERYHEYHEGCSVPWGYLNIKRLYPPTGTHDTLHVQHDIPHAT